MLLTWISGLAFQQFLNIPEKFINFKILRSIWNREIELLFWQLKGQTRFEQKMAILSGFLQYFVIYQHVHVCVAFDKSLLVYEKIICNMGK